ncbi:MAG TPA: SagB family peptide dehydrogenase [Ktedonobacteraceae bacterium]|nr:SagB family peptide dehydrogenase [Ktedonobacteraceae bacterium]
MLESKEHPGKRYLSIGEHPLSSLDHINWKTAPPIFKLYRDCPHIALTDAQGNWQHACEHTNRRELSIGSVLASIYGLTRQNRTTAEALQTAFGYAAGNVTRNVIHSFLRRPVPSGGGLFPCEVYLLVGQGQNLPSGIYHYDALHHALDILRVGDYSAYLKSCLMQQEGDAPALALLLSCFFWKSGYKYLEFGYRLQSLDIGVVIAQSLLAVSSEAWQPIVHYLFLDQVANQLLGLEHLYESTYAVISLCMQQTAEEQEASLHALAPIPWQVEPEAGPTTSLAQWPLLEKLHRASQMTAPIARTEPQRLPSLPIPSGSSIALPLPASLDMRNALYQRHSARLYFKRGEITQQQMSALLTEGARGYTNDLDGYAAVLQHTLLYCVINAVEGMQPGIYVYYAERGALELLYAGDSRGELQDTLTWSFSYNMWNVSVCIFPVADYEQGFAIYGDRWYRIQNMEAGMLIQRLYLCSAALELGCQANLGYHTARACELLRLPQGWRCLAQILLGPEEQAGQYYEQVLW